MVRRLGFLAATLLWLTIICLPALALVVAIRGELNLGNIEKSHIRVFMVHSDEENGLGFEWSRKVKNKADCQETSVRYLLWDSDSKDVNIDYCHCYKDINGQAVFDRSC